MIRRVSASERTQKRTQFTGAQKGRSDSGNRWTGPLGGGIGKIFRFGKLPGNVQAQFYFNVEHPEVGPEWQTRIQFQFLFPKS